MGGRLNPRLGAGATKSACADSDVGYAGVFSAQVGFYVGVSMRLLSSLSQGAGECVRMSLPMKERPAYSQANGRLAGMDSGGEGVFAGRIKWGSRSVNGEGAAA